MTTPAVGQAKRSSKRAADYTGRLTTQLQEERKTELLEASQRVALVTAAEAAKKDEIIDLTGSDEPIPQAVLKEVEVSTPYRIIRVNQNIDQMTFGRKVVDPGEYNDPDTNKHRPAIMGPMQYYDFIEGQPYRVPKDVADHLAEKGYIAYISGA